MSNYLNSGTAEAEPALPPDSGEASPVKAGEQQNASGHSQEMREEHAAQIFPQPPAT